MKSKARAQPNAAVCRYCFARATPNATVCMSLMLNLNQAVPNIYHAAVQQVRRVRHFHDSLKWYMSFMPPCLLHIFPVELIAHFLRRHLRIRCLEGLRHFLHGVEHQIEWRPQEFQRHALWWQSCTDRSSRYKYMYLLHITHATGKLQVLKQVSSEHNWSEAPQHQTTCLPHNCGHGEADPEPQV